MSRQVEVALPSKCDNKEALIAALVKMGFAREVIEEGDHLVLEGYDGSTRETVGGGLVDSVQIRIKRKHVGRVSNDIGFYWSDKVGGYVASISDYDASRFNKGWLGKLTQWHHAYKARYEAESLGYGDWEMNYNEETESVEMRATSWS